MYFEINSDVFGNPCPSPRVGTPSLLARPVDPPNIRHCMLIPPPKICQPKQSKKMIIN